MRSSSNIDGYLDPLASGRLDINPDDRSFGLWVFRSTSLREARQWLDDPMSARALFRSTSLREARLVVTKKQFQVVKI